MTATDRPKFPLNRFTIGQVQDFWDGVIDVYDRANEKIGHGHTQRFVRGLAYFQGGRDARILNIWARTGEAVPHLRARFPQGRRVHCEVSPAMIAVARERYPGEDFRQTDLARLELDSESFDAALSLETLEHCPDPFRFLCELHRVIRPGGELVLSCPSRTAEPMLRVYEKLFENHGEGPHRFLWSYEVKRMLQAAGFQLIEHRGTLFLPIGPSRLSRLDDLLAAVVGRTPLGELGIRQFYYCRKR
jgi:ubiquinone/menaquinone biosynthesis C-methylase UbiE